MFAKGFNKVLLNRVGKSKQSDVYQSPTKVAIEDKTLLSTSSICDEIEMANMNNKGILPFKTESLEEPSLNEILNNPSEENSSEDISCKFEELHQLVPDEEILGTQFGHTTENSNVQNQVKLLDEDILNMAYIENENIVDESDTLDTPLAPYPYIQFHVEKGLSHVHGGNNLQNADQPDANVASNSGAIEDDTKELNNLHGKTKLISEEQDQASVPQLTTYVEERKLELEAIKPDIESEQPEGFTSDLCRGKDVNKVDENKIEPEPLKELWTDHTIEAPTVKQSENIRSTNENLEAQECDEIVVSNSPILPDFEEIADEEKESTEISKVDSPPPPPDTTFRKLARPLSQDRMAEDQKKKKRHWGKKETKEIDQEEGPNTDILSGELLKDIVPDVKPYLEDLSKDDELDHEQETEEEETNGEDQEEEKPHQTDDPSKKKMDPATEILPSHRSSEDINAENQPIIKCRKGSLSNLNPDSSCVIEVRNLVRPFTLIQFKELLLRTGKIKNIENGGFWIDKIKSHAIVEYLSPDEAGETVMALDGVKWPSTNPKTLNVTFSTKKVLEKAVNDNEVPLKISSGKEYHRSSSNKEEKDDPSRKRKHSEGQNESSSGNYYEPSSPNKRVRSNSEKEICAEGNRSDSPKPKKRLDDLFRKTKALPCIYWMPKQQKVAKS